VSTKRPKKYDVTLSQDEAALVAQAAALQHLAVASYVRQTLLLRSAAELAKAEQRA
jgi:hypothetical protein